MNPRALRVAGPVILLVAAAIALVAGLVYGGGSAPLSVGDPGPWVRWGLPAAQMSVNLGASIMIGGFAIALFALKPEDAAFGRALDIASVGAAIFTVAAGFSGFLTFVNVFNPEVSADPLFGEQLGNFLLKQEAGTAWLLTTIGGAIITVLAFAVRAWTPTLIVGLAAVAALVPRATQGHSGDLSGHNIAVSSAAMHTMAAALWLGGLVLLVLLRPMLGNKIVRVVERYSSLALVAFMVTAMSGVIRSVVGVVDWNGLFGSAYGILILVKAALLTTMGIMGAFYRRFLIRKMVGGEARSPFWFLIAGELALMGLASGFASALARTPPPQTLAPPRAPTPAEYLTGSPLPPELTLERWFTSWSLDPIWFIVVLFGIFFYLAGVWRLKRRGDAWPIYRTVLWVAGLLALLWITNGPINAYQNYLFSVHMLGHMLLSMAIPLLLVPGAPVTLAARAIRRRSDGTRGAREWILWAVHTPYARVITNPFIAAAIFIVSLWLFYYTDLFRWAMYDHLGHQWMIVHFLISGYLFVQSLAGIDPVPYRLPYAGRLLLLIGIMAMHAFFGISIMMASGLMLSEWYGAMGRTWGPTPMEDQYIAGGIAWSIGEIPTFITAVVVGVLWSKSDEKTQRRRDRHADRTGEAELEEYNARLAKLAERDAAAARRGQSRG